MQTINLEKKAICTTVKNDREFTYEIILLSIKKDGIKYYKLLRRWFYNDTIPPSDYFETEWSLVGLNTFQDKLKQKTRLNYKIRYENN